MDSFDSTKKLIDLLNDNISSPDSARGDYQNLFHNRSIDDLIIAFMAKHNIPGLSVAIVQAPYITRIVGYGFADLATKRLMASHSMVNIGQMTNAYTAVAIMQLIENKQLQLSDNITIYLTGIPANWPAITIYDLLTHSSGIPCYKNMNLFERQEFTASDIFNLLENVPLKFTPGTNVNESATNYYILGQIIEKVSGIPYEDYVTKNQFEKIGLQHTCFISNLQKIPNELIQSTKPFKHHQFLHEAKFINPTELATGYEEKDNQLQPVTLSDIAIDLADSGIITSAEDISLWDVALAGDILIKDPSLRAILYNPAKLKNDVVVPGNACWHFSGRPGVMEITGNSPGYSSLLTRYTASDELLCVTLIANKGDINELNILSKQIAGAYNSHLAVPKQASSNMTVQSPYSVDDTAIRLKHILTEAGVHIFACIDHSAAAAKANLFLSPTKVILFGNPAVGTHLMQVENTIALELPLRALIWQDEQQQVWLSMTDIQKVAYQYDLDNQLKGLINKMNYQLHKIMNEVIGPS